MKKIADEMEKICKIVFSIIMAAMLLILVLHVTMRYLFNKPLIWTDEVTTILQGTIAFLGIGYCFMRKQHTELSLLYDRVPQVVQWTFDLITNSVMIFCLYKITIASIGYVAKQNIALGTISWLNKSYFYMFIPVGFVIAIIYLTARVLHLLQTIFESTRKEN
ncbi:MAG: TRAP transporter small permease [Lachnospiraceae bacterium]|nr:TRAP transporter small permease [Lachnospiraceae bacterium]